MATVSVICALQLMLEQRASKDLRAVRDQQRCQLAQLGMEKAELQAACAEARAAAAASASRVTATAASMAADMAHKDDVSLQARSL